MSAVGNMIDADTELIFKLKKDNKVLLGVLMDLYNSTACRCMEITNELDKSSLISFSMDKDIYISME